MSDTTTDPVPAPKTPAPKAPEETVDQKRIRLAAELASLGGPVVPVKTTARRFRVAVGAVSGIGVGPDGKTIIHKDFNLGEVVDEDDLNGHAASYFAQGSLILLG